MFSLLIIYGSEVKQLKRGCSGTHGVKNCPWYKKDEPKA